MPHQSSLLANGLILYQDLLFKLATADCAVGKDVVQKWSIFETTVANAIRDGEMDSDSIDAISILAQNVVIQVAELQGLAQRSTDDVNGLSHKINEIILEDTDSKSCFCDGPDSGRLVPQEATTQRPRQSPALIQTRLPSPNNEVSPLPLAQTLPVTPSYPSYQVHHQINHLPQIHPQTPPSTVPRPSPSILPDPPFEPLPLPYRENNPLQSRQYNPSKT
jgi:hypothetical protein